MAGRAQRIIWFLLPSPCCLPTHFLICLKIIRSTLFVLSSCSHSLLLKLFHLLNFLFFWFCLDFIKSQTQKHLHVKHFLQRTNTHTHTQTHTRTQTHHSSFCVQVRRMLQECGNNKKLSLANLNPAGCYHANHMGCEPTLWRRRDDGRSDPPSPHSGGAVQYRGWSMESREETYTHTEKKV